MFVNHADRIIVQNEKKRWEKLLELWRSERHGWSLAVDGHQVSIDGVWRLPIKKAGDIQLKGGGIDNKPQKVRWWIHRPLQAVYNLDPEFRGGKSFTGQAGRYVQSRKELIAETEDFSLAARTWKKYLPYNEQAGVLRIQAELITGEVSEWTPIMEVRVRIKEGFLGALSEQFGSPYVFGIGRLKSHGESGPETLIGNDCANFIVYGLRQNGYRIPWCNPKQLKLYMVKIGDSHKPQDRTNLGMEAMQSELIIHLGSHVAALWQDLGEKGVLEPEDLVIHHLSGFPEIIPLKKLLKKHDSYQLMRLDYDFTRSTLLLGGDVNLAGVTSTTKVFSERYKEIMKNADFTALNLECAIVRGSGELVGLKKKRFRFIGKPMSLDHLIDAGVDAVFLANNHSMDAGGKGLLETMLLLEKKKISHFGAGMNRAKAGRLAIHTVGSQQVAFVAFNTIEAELSVSGETRPGVLSYPQHLNQIRHLLHRAQVRADFVVVLPHWGDEYTGEVNSQQRSIAKWCIESGADAVVGSHSHHPQRAEYYHGVPVIYSLGNLYFPNRGPKGFNQYQLLKLGINKSLGLRVLDWKAQ